MTAVLSTLATAVLCAAGLAVACLAGVVLIAVCDLASGRAAREAAAVEAVTRGRSE